MAARPVLSEYPPNSSDTARERPERAPGQRSIGGVLRYADTESPCWFDAAQMRAAMVGQSALAGWGDCQSFAQLGDRRPFSTVWRHHPEHHPAGFGNHVAAVGRRDIVQDVEGLLHTGLGATVDHGAHR